MAHFGIDIGGTKIGVCRSSTPGVVDAQASFETLAYSTAKEALDAVHEAVERLASEAGETIDAVGVACPGPFDRLDRRFLTPPNMPAWHGFDLGAWLDARFEAPTRAMNDANAAALAEHRWGGYEDAHVLVFLTCSTGMGSGIVIDGVPFEGRRGFAGEVGRTKLAEFGPVGFGAQGTAEGFLSGPGIAQLARAEAIACVQSGEATGLRSLGETSVTRAVCELALAGDPAAKRVTDTAAVKLGELAAILVNILEPDAIVLGTIPIAFPDLFLPRATEAMRTNAVPESVERVRLTTSRLEDRGHLQALAAASIAE